MSNKPTHWFIADRRTTRRDNKLIRVGRSHVLRNKKPIILCSNGYHASKNISDAAYYALLNGKFWSSYSIYRVSLSGDVIHSSDKSAGRIRTYHKAIHNIPAHDIEQLYRGNPSTIKTVKYLMRKA